MSFLLPSANRGRPANTDQHEALNAIRYLARVGCGWCRMPSHFGLSRSNPLEGCN